MAALRLFLTALAALLALGCSPEATQAESGARVTTLAEGLEHPWAMAFLPEGDLLVTERPGTLLRLNPDNGERTALAGVPEVDARSQPPCLASKDMSCRPHRSREAA